MLKSKYLSIKVYGKNFFKIIRITVMLAFRYKKFFLIFTFFSNSCATSKKGNWDQLYCYRFIGKQRES